MTNDERSPNDEARTGRESHFVIFDFVIPSSFVTRASSFFLIYSIHALAPSASPYVAGVDCRVLDRFGCAGTFFSNRAIPFHSLERRTRVRRFAQAPGPQDSHATGLGFCWDRSELARIPAFR